MPRISAFYGIAIYMYFRDHAPPHFHAIYGEYEAIVDIDTAQIMAGNLPTRARSLVIDWATMHQGELRDNWQRAQDGQPLDPVPPLD